VFSAGQIEFANDNCEMETVRKTTQPARLSGQKHIAQGEAKRNPG